MKKTLFCIIAMLGAAVALAGAHFLSASASFVGSGPNVAVTFKEAGLGNNTTANYLLTATATVNYACINNGGQNPSAANKQQITTTVAVPGTFTSDRNGNIVGKLTLTPPPPTLNCPPGQTLVLVAVKYTNLRVIDTTNNTSKSISGTFSRVFFPRYL